MYSMLATSALQTTMTLQEFFFMLLWMALIGVAIMFVAILFRLFQTLGDIREVIKENKGNISGIMNELPGITKSVNDLTTEATNAASAFKPSVQNIADITESTTATMKDNNPVNEAIVSAYKTVNNVSKLVDSASKKNKKTITIDLDKDLK